MQIISDLETVNRAIGPDEGSVDYDGYYCIQTVPHRCNCSPNRPWTFVHYDKKVVIWEEKDDDAILDVAREFKNHNYDPKIIEYKPIFGKAIEWAEIPNGASVA